MNEFEQLVRKRWGNRYNLTKDIEGYYAVESVRHMYDIWCICKGIIK